jgi:hypothetical protein
MVCGVEFALKSCPFTPHSPNMPDDPSLVCPCSLEFSMEPGESPVVCARRGDRLEHS